MRIISDFRDYYDCLQQSDQDKETLFLRNRGTQQYHKDLSTFGFDVVVGFAGKLYPGMNFPIIEGKPRKVLGWYDNFKIRTEWNYGSTEYFYDDEVLQELNDKEKKGYWWRKSGTDPLTAVRSTKLAEELTIRFGPIFVLSSTGYSGNSFGLSVVQNERLNQFNFQRALSPPQAYQLLTQYVYNLAVAAKPIPEMDNDTKVALAGFNLKTSFRKPKKGRANDE